MGKGVILNFLFDLMMWNSVKLRFMELYRLIKTTTVPISVVPFVFQFLWSERLEGDNTYCVYYRIAVDWCVIIKKIPKTKDRICEDVIKYQDMKCLHRINKI